MYRLFCNNKMLVCRNFFEHFLDADIDRSKLSAQLFENTLDKIKNWLENGEENLYIDDIDNDILAAVIKEIFRFQHSANIMHLSPFCQNSLLKKAQTACRKISAGGLLCIYLVPKIRSPASPRPGTM